MKVKALNRIFVHGFVHDIGEVFEIPDEEAKAFGKSVEVIEKNLSKPLKDKMIKKPIKKK
jgi:hypothetical protein